jgi:hypothetical protein
MTLLYYYSQIIIRFIFSLWNPDMYIHHHINFEFILLSGYSLNTIHTLLSLDSIFSELL